MKRELNTDVNQHVDTQSSSKAAKLSVSQPDSPISKQFSKECVEAIDFYKKNYPARLFELMNKFTTGNLSKNSIKAEYKLLESKLKIFQSLLDKHIPNSPAYLRAEEFYTNYFEVFQIVKSFLFCHEIAKMTDNTQPANDQAITRIQQWITYYNYQSMGTLLFLNALTDPSVRKNMLDELLYHVHFLTTLKRFIHRSTQQFPASTYDDHLKNNALSILVAEPFDEISAIYNIINSLNVHIPEHISTHANLLANNLATLNNTEKLEKIIVRLEKFRVGCTNSSENIPAYSTVSQYLELIQKIREEISPVILAIKSVSDFIYSTNFSDDTLYFFEKLVEKEIQLSTHLESLEEIKMHIESMIRENNSIVTTIKD